MKTKTLLKLGTLAVALIIVVQVPCRLGTPAPVAVTVSVEICAAHGSETLARIKAVQADMCGAQAIDVRKTVNGYLLMAEGVSTTGNAIRLARVAAEYVNRQIVRQSADALRSCEIARTRLEMSSAAASPHQVLAQARNRQARLESDLLVLRHEYEAACRQLKAINAALEATPAVCLEYSAEVVSLRGQREQQHQEVVRWEAAVREGHPVLVRQREKLAATETRLVNLQFTVNDRHSGRRQALLKEQTFFSEKSSQLNSALAALEAQQRTIEREIELAMDRIVRDREMLVPDWKPLAVRPEPNRNHGIPPQSHETLSPEQPEKAPRGMSSSVLYLGSSY